ncbi:hypothetical protein B0J14DRAFT_609730 [Halenospora varia]|nr:hypothetical protein B0J14DRAFT_609730 [Halenospora varia]
MGFISAISEYFWPRPQRKKHASTKQRATEPRLNSGPNYLADGGPINPRLRLSMSDPSPTIYGYPKKIPRSPSHLLTFTTRMPALISYVLGADWRSRCVATSSNNRSVKEWSYIVSPDDEVDEAEHCLRMRRCSAYLVQPGVHFSPQTECYNQKISRYIMGWPSDGSVLVYHLPSNNPTDKTIEEQFASLARYNAGLEEEPSIKIGRLMNELVKQNEMDGFCGVLGNWGAEHYKNISNCPEVKEFGLLNSDESNNFLSKVYLT